MKLNPNIFKAYDIRGLCPDEVNEATAKNLGSAAVVFFSLKYRKKNPLILVASDTRASSASLKRALLEGIISHGGDAIDIGDATTPLFYFGVSFHKADAGIMVTASHNPPEYNGFKIVGKNAEFIGRATGLEKIKKIMSAPRKSTQKVFGRVRTEIYAARTAYIDFLFSNARIANKIKVAVDASGGATALILPELLNRFPIIYKPLFFAPDPNFSSHNPNPLIKSAQEPVKKELFRGGYALGVVFDGDGDRAVFFDERGERIPSHAILGIIAEKEIRRQKGAGVVYELTMSRALEELIKERGGRPIKTRVGRIFVKDAMKKSRAAVGGESSGHFYFREFSNSDSAILAFLKVAEILSETKKPISRLAAPFRKYFQSGEINFKVENPKKIMLLLLKHFKRLKPKPIISSLDGLSVEFSDWWFNLRPSNTEPLVRLNVEAKTKELLDEKILFLKKTIATFGW